MLRTALSEVKKTLAQQLPRGSKKQDLRLIVLGDIDRSVHNLQDIGAQKVPLPKDPDTGAVLLENLPMLHDLLEFELGELHQAVDFILWSIEVFDAESIHRDDFDAALVADFQDLEAQTQLLDTQGTCHDVRPGGLNCLDRTRASASKPKWWPSTVSIL